MAVRFISDGKTALYVLQIKGRLKTQRLLKQSCPISPFALKALLRNIKIHENQSTEL
ncbi:hypothetical protein NEIFL0001_0883 [Neisseria flavescens SK114]|nr:hypothetical protein NEIFL0001_0883 [Neisseria flavescens SK114]